MVQEEQPNIFWQTTKGPQGTLVTLDGILDAYAPLDELATQITGPTTFDLMAVQRITSHGVQQWIRFIAAIQGTGPHTLQRCAPAFVDQMNIIANFHNTAKVKSVCAPFYCASCDAEAPIIIDSSTGKTLPSANCPTCKGPMELDDLPEKYLRWF